MFLSDVFCGEISDVIYNVRKLHFCKCHLWYKRNLLTFFYLRFIIVFDHQTVSVSATDTAVRQSSVSALVSATAVTEYSVSAHFRLRPKPEKMVSFGLYATVITPRSRTLLLGAILSLPSWMDFNLLVNAGCIWNHFRHARDSADHDLFCVIAHNPLHVFHPLLPHAQKNCLQFM